MQKKFLWFGFAATLIMALVCMEDSEAQPGKKGKKGGFPREPVSADQIVERIMSYDKNNDGKITMDELPERMQHLIALGDLNKDGALDKEEIRKLATTLESFAALTGGGGPGGGGPGGGGPGGGPKGPPGKGGLKGIAADAQRTLDDLNVTGDARDKADRVLKTHQDKVRRFEDVARAELILEMKDVLSEDDYRAFKTALNLPPGKGPPGGKGFDGKGFGKGPFGKGPPPPEDINSRIDQLQKDLDDLRKKLPK
jgi:EF hand